jgi:hypothetical protein
LNGALAGESLPLVFEDGVDENTTYGHPSYSQKMKILFFASDMDGGFGGKDIWYSTYDALSDTWKTPVNLGPRVNSIGDEMFSKDCLSESVARRNCKSSQVPMA